MAAFETRIRIRFRHCDPAGIVFFPRWFELLNDVVEDWFDRGLGCDFQTLHEEMQCGIPALHTEADYRAPGRLGEDTHWRLGVAELGGSSLGLRVTADGADGTPRVAFYHRIVFAGMGPPPRARRWPEELRARMAEFMDEAADRADAVD